MTFLPKHALAATALLLLLTSCATHRPPASQLSAEEQALGRVKQTFAPDSHLVIFNVSVRQEGGARVLSGDVDNAEAKGAAVEAMASLGGEVRDEITVLPAADLGDKTWGICAVSLLNVREKPGNASEMGTQILMGNAFKIWKKETNWFLVQSSDGYLGWTEGGPFAVCDQQAVKTWNASSLLIVTALEDCVLERPEEGALPVSDVTLCDLLKPIGETGDWYQVALADGRSGYLPKNAAADYAHWRKERAPTADNIERTAKSFLGRPYSWGCNSPRGMDCSGFTKLVYYLNGVDLARNASEQARQGVEIPLDANFSQLKKGDLLFFGRRGDRGRPEKVNHVGIYLGNKLFIQASGMIRVSSLDPASPLHEDRQHRRELLHARRALPGS